MLSLKKILLVSPYIDEHYGGGIVTSVLNYYKSLRSLKDVRVTLVALSTNIDCIIDKNILDNENILLFNVEINSWKYSRRFVNFLKNNIYKYDLVWVHGIWLSPSFFTAKFAKKYNVPYVVTPHGSLNPYAIKQKRFKKKLYWNLVEKNIFKHAKAIHCLTTFESLSVEKLSNAKTFVQPNSIETFMYVKKNYTSIRNICFIGRFHHKKGLDLLLKALSDIKNLTLLIAGNGDKAYTEYIHSIVETYKLQRQIKFLGFVDEKTKKEIFAQSLFCVIPSYSEGLAMVGLEAIANSTPVLVTKHCDFEIVEEYDAGIVIENNHPESIKKGIVKMLNKDIETMSKNAFKLAKEVFDVKIVGKQLINNLSKIMH